MAAIDLNLGCPAPIVYRKCAGGGLLREPERIDAILGALRDAVQIKFTVKTRLGFASADEFDRLLSIFAKHSLDALTVHARTVAQMYRLPVHYDRIRQAVETMPCPVIANGHVYSAAQAQDLLRANRRARLDDRARRDPEPVALQSDSPAAARRAPCAADRARRRGLHPRVVGLAGVSSTAREGRSASA